MQNNDFKKVKNDKKLTSLNLDKKNLEILEKNKINISKLVRYLIDKYLQENKLN